MRLVIYINSKATNSYVEQEVYAEERAAMSARNMKLLVGSSLINLLKPTGHVTHQQFNIQQLYVLPTVFMCFVFI